MLLMMSGARATHFYFLHEPSSHLLSWLLTSQTKQ